MAMFGNEFVVYSKTVTCEVMERDLLLYWNSKHLRENAFFQSGLEKQAVFSAPSKTSNQFITMEDRVPFHDKALWDLRWKKREL
jgi:hypothetical protein